MQLVDKVCAMWSPLGGVYADFLIRVDILICMYAS
jgi:hypothetical protein